MIFSIIGTFQLFTEPSLLQRDRTERDHERPSPRTSTRYNLAFVNQELNYAAAIAFLLGLVIAVDLVRRAARRRAKRARRREGGCR